MRNKARYTRDIYVKKRKTLEPTDKLGILFWVGYIIFIVIMLFAALGLVAQTVNIKQKSLSQIDIEYNGQPIQISAISIIVGFDNTLYELDSAVTLHPYDTLGTYLNTPPGLANSLGKVAMGWVSGSPDDTILLTNGSVYSLYFRQATDTCTLLHFGTLPGDCEIADLTGLVYPMAFVDTIICNSTTSIQPVTYRNAFGRSYDLLGRPNDKGVIIRNGRKYLKVK